MKNITVDYKASKKNATSIFTLKMAPIMFTKTLDNFQHSVWLTPESRNFTLNITAWLPCP
jgi:hypothetical protein